MAVFLEKSEKCLNCEITFGEGGVSYKAKNLCNSCYYKSRIPAKPQYTACRECNIEWGGLNKKGKVVHKSTASGYCRSCYMKQYSKKTQKICIECNEPILNRTIKDVCKRCFVPTRQKQRKKPVKSVKEKNIHNKEEMEQYEDLRKLLNRYKFGVSTDVDNYKVADYFVSMVCKEVNFVKYDGMDIESQIIYMLKDLKEKYMQWSENNNKKISYSSQK